MNTKVFNNFTAFLDRLEQQDISYTLVHNQAETLMVLVAVPGERWEIEFMSDGSVEIEKFISIGEISDTKSLEDLFANYADEEDNTASSGAKELISSADLSVPC
jgi:hypothetical protein